MRRRLALRVLRDLRPRTVLEAGSGDGNFLVDLSELAQRVVGVEPGSESLAEARAIVDRLPNIELFDSWGPEVGDGFDCLVALEVLEHIPDDVTELRSWLTRLRPRGHVVLSVPAHMRLWTSADTEVGHVRRYSKGDLVGLLEGCSLAPIHLWSYGFPLTWLSRRVRSSHTERTALAGDAASRTLVSARASYSGLGRSWTSAVAFSALGGLGHLAQLPFRGTELGDGWLVVARKLT